MTTYMSEVERMAARIAELEAELAVVNANRVLQAQHIRDASVVCQAARAEVERVGLLCDMHEECSTRLGDKLITAERQRDEAAGLLEWLDGRTPHVWACATSGDSSTCPACRISTYLAALKENTR